MSKYVKQLVSDEIRKRLSGVSDAVLVNVIGLDTAKTYSLRRKLREKNIQLLVVKNSLAKRATEGTPLSAAFKGGGVVGDLLRGDGLRPVGQRYHRVAERPAV